MQGEARVLHQLLSGVVAGGAAVHSESFFGLETGELSLLAAMYFWW